LAEVVFSSWGGKVVDNRQGGEPEAAVFKLPENYLDEGKIAAFMGWDGVIVLDREGIIRAIHRGTRTRDQFVAELENLL